MKKEKKYKTERKKIRKRNKLKKIKSRE